ncbi:hypothetical protein [Povalibacter sp.]|uniref:hypothetical protein n=1 Tax=Povalibacter sp. TaxID=1962978 RepID=UPI002F40D2CD
MATKRIDFEVAGNTDAYWIVVEKQFVKLRNGSGSRKLKIRDTEYLITGHVVGDTNESAKFTVKDSGRKLLEFEVKVPKKKSRDVGVDYAYFWVRE